MHIHTHTHTNTHTYIQTFSNVSNVSRRAVELALGDGASKVSMAHIKLAVAELTQSLVSEG